MLSKYSDSDSDSDSAQFAAQRKGPEVGNIKE